MILSPMPILTAVLLCYALPEWCVDWDGFANIAQTCPSVTGACSPLRPPLQVSSYGLLSGTSRVPRHARRTLNPPGAGVSNQIHRFKISTSATDDCFCTASASREIQSKTARLAPQTREAFLGTHFAKMIKANQVDLARPSMDGPSPREY